MAFFFCSQCDSQFQAIQVSRKIFGEGEQRTLKYEPGTGIQMGDWQSLSESFHGFRDGYYIIIRATAGLVMSPVFCFVQRMRNKT